MSHVQSAIDAVKQLPLPEPPAAVPSHLQGLLQRHAPAHQPVPGALHRILFRGPEGRPLRSQPSFLADFCGEVRSSSNSAEFSASVAALQSRLMGTGAYKRVSAALEQPLGAAASSLPASPDLVITLDEHSFGLTAGAMAGMQGEATMGATASLINALGYAESVSLTLGNEVPMAYGVGGMDGGSGSPFGGFMGGAEQGLASLPAGGGSSSSSAAPAVRGPAPDANWRLEARKPTLGGSAASLGLCLRRDGSPLEALSTPRLRVLEGEATLADASGAHTLSLATALRQLSPLRLPGHAGARATLSSPETLPHCAASVKNSAAYALRLGGGLLPSEALPASGQRALARLELAGLGGDVSFLRLALSGTWAASLGRYAPDTGYSLPGKAAEPGLQPFPGAAGTLPWCSSSSSSGGGGGSSSSSSNNSSSSALPSPFSERLAAWLSPGITLAVDGFLGYLQPLRSSSSTSSTSSTSSSHLCDRFFQPYGGRAMRGFASMGARGSAVGGGGAPLGDALGGDALLALTARVLLPPPLPIPALVDAGVRSYAWGSIGASALHAGSSSLLAAPWDIARTLAQRPSASVGVGLVSVLRRPQCAH